MVFRKTFIPDPLELKQACQKPLHPDAVRGIEAYNQGEYFLAHEHLEDAWNQEGEPDRRLYQGILQAGILCMRARQGKYRAVFSMYTRMQVWLTPWPDRCRGLDIGQLKADIATLVAEVERLGPGRLDQLDERFFTRIKKSENPSTT